MAKKQKEAPESAGAAIVETESVVALAPEMEAASETEQAPETKTALDSKPHNPVKALRVVSARDFFRRAGILFGTIPVTLNPDELTQEQIDQICNEPMLTAAWVLAD